MSVHEDLLKLRNHERAKHSQHFFKTGKGQYGEGDVFLGITVPVQRAIAKKYRDISFSEIASLLHSPFHEYRATALMVMLLQWVKSDERKKKQLYELYMMQRAYINNWDLVDISAPTIVGEWLFMHPEKRHLLTAFALSKHLWERRIAVLATFAFIRKNEFSETLALSKFLLQDKEDLIHKAVGWMLREVGKRSVAAEEEFLQKHYKIMPRTMLRYAIEKFSTKKRRFYLA